MPQSVRCSLTHTENKSITPNEKACLLVGRRSDESVATHHNVYWELEFDPELISRERSMPRVDSDDEQSLAGPGCRPDTDGLEEAVREDLLVALCMAVAAETADSMDEKTAEQSCREEHSPATTETRGLDFSARHSGPDGRILRRMPRGARARVVRRCCGSGGTDDVHWLARATGSLLPSLAADAFMEKKT